MLYKHVWLGCLTRNAYVVRGVKRQNACVRDLNSYPPENGFTVCEISFKSLITAYLWGIKSCTSVNYLIY